VYGLPEPMGAWVRFVTGEGGLGHVSGSDRSKNRRAYRPKVEGLEVLRLLSGPAEVAVDVAMPVDSATAPGGGGEALSIPDATWDAALVAQLDDLFGPILDHSDATEVSAGLSQLDRYLGRTWYRAGLSPQQHDDCTQAVYATLLQSLGRDRFDQLLGEVGHYGIRDVLSRETAEGPDFFRAIDTVKKRAQRERTFQPLDLVDAASINRPENLGDDWKSTLQEAILASLSPREAALIQATLQGETPAEIAQQWGVAPKTVSNEKTRALQKLREALSSDFAN
jgi:RNA polymerase sigma factor (sigma-70 family)